MRILFFLLIAGAAAALEELPREFQTLDVGADGVQILCTSTNGTFSRETVAWTLPDVLRVERVRASATSFWEVVSFASGVAVTNEFLLTFRWGGEVKRIPAVGERWTLANVRSDRVNRIGIYTNSAGSSNVVIVGKNRAELMTPQRPKKGEVKPSKKERKNPKKLEQKLVPAPAVTNRMKRAECIFTRRLPDGRIEQSWRNGVVSTNDVKILHTRLIRKGKPKQ